MTVLKDNDEARAMFFIQNSFYFQSKTIIQQNRGLHVENNFLQVYFSTLQTGTWTLTK